MVQLVKPKQIHVVTKEGECHITLDVNITLNHEGVIQAVGVEPKDAKFKKKPVDEEEKFKWEIPDFETGSEKIDFGKES